MLTKQEAQGPFGSTAVHAIQFTLAGLVCSVHSVFNHFIVQAFKCRPRPWRLLPVTERQRPMPIAGVWPLLAWLLLAGFY